MFQYSAKTVKKLEFHTKCFRGPLEKGIFTFQEFFTESKLDNLWLRSSQICVKKLGTLDLDVGEGRFQVVNLLVGFK